MIGNKIADKITYIGETKSKKEKMKQKKFTYHKKKIQQIIDDLRCLRHHTKMEYQNINSYYIQQLNMYLDLLLKMEIG